MRWRGRRGSGNVQDRRGRSGKGLAAGGGIGGIIVLVLYFLLGGDSGELPTQMSTGLESSVHQPTAEEEELAQMVSVILADNEEVWHKLFAEKGLTYREPALVLFTDAVQSACGGASSASGPFYCPADEKIYIDLSFYKLMKNQLNAPGDFAMAYVVAHEVGHHVQNLLGISEQVQAERGRVSETEYNQLSVRLELQADFLAGVWAHHAHDEFNILEEGDIEEAMNAANAIGDDMLQKKSQGHVVPDAFTHGTSAQRVRWFTKGFKTGDPEQGDTFATNAL